MNFKNLFLGLSLTLIGLSNSSVFAASLHKHLQARVVESHGLTNKQKLDPVTMAADSFMVRGKSADAVDLYRRAINNNPNNIHAIAWLGIAYGKLFKLDAADEQFDKALSIDPHYALAYAGKAMVCINHLQSSSVTIAKKREPILQQAENFAKQAVANSDGLPEAHYSLGLVYKEQGLIDKSITEFQKAINLNKDFSEAYSALGMDNIVKGNLPAAEANFKQAIALDSGNSTAHYGLGRVYLKQDQIDNAIKELNTSLYQNRNNSPVHEALGGAYEAQGNNVAAVKEYQEAIRIKAESPQAYVQIAQIRQSRGDLEHAIAELRSGLDIFPDNPGLHLWIANQSLQLAKCDDAIDEYMKVLQLDPNNKEAAIGLIRACYVKSQKLASGVLLSSSDVEKADKLITRLVELTPSDVELRLAQAKLHILMGKSALISNTTEPKNDAERMAYAEALLADHKINQATDEIKKVVDNLTTAKQLFAAGDLALMIHDLDGADAAYKKAATISGAEERAKRSLGLVSNARNEAFVDMTLAKDLAAKKQLPSAVDKYTMAIYEDPALPDAHLGMAKALEQVAPNSLEELKKVKLHYQTYLDLKKNLTEKERQKLTKHMEKLESKTVKLSQHIDDDNHKSQQSAEQ